MMDVPGSHTVLDGEMLPRWTVPETLLGGKLRPLPHCLAGKPRHCRPGLDSGYFRRSSFNKASVS
jgi:hypothetical protein